MKIRKHNDIVILLLGFCSGMLAAWYILDSIIFGALYGMVVVLGIMFILKKRKKKDEMFHNIDAAYNFVNLMNVSMLSTTSVYEAYKSIENYVDADFANMSNEDIRTHLNEIATTYDINAFKMYINTLLIYDSDGGNYKEMQSIPTSLTQNTKIYYHKLDTRKFYKLVEITSLFALWICILVFIKICIPDYYALMMKDILYQIIMLGMLLIGSFLYYLTYMEYLNNNIRGM